MKFISLMLSVLLLWYPVTPPNDSDPALPSFPVIAPTDETEILQGTPLLDGELDEIYLQSFCYYTAPGENFNYPSGNVIAQAALAQTTGAAYYLYDPYYLYVCVVVHDETLMSMGEEWRTNTEWPWKDDGAELYFWFSDNHCFAVHTDAFGYRSVVDEQIWGDNHESARIYSDTPQSNYAVSQRPDEDIYIIEIRIALDEGMGEGARIGTLLEINDRFSLQAESNTGAQTVIGALFPMPRNPAADNFMVQLSERSATAESNTSGGTTVFDWIVSGIRQLLGIE